MSNQKIWFITGASRGTGVDFALKAEIDAEQELSASLAFD